MKYGIIFCGYGTLDTVAQALNPWIEMRTNPDYDICIAAVSVRFAGFEGEDDGTRERLRQYNKDGEIDYLIDGPDGITEADARGRALSWLQDEAKVDIIVQFDSDEIANIEELKRAINFVNDNPFIAWFKIAYRNLVFNEKTWLAEPFTPPRIHRVKAGTFTLHSFSGDNDICYSRDGGLWHQSEVPSMIIPPNICNPKHYTWLSDTPSNKARSKTKQLYQTKRGWKCSFIWDENRDTLAFDPTLPLPTTVRDES